MGVFDLFMKSGYMHGIWILVHCRGTRILVDMNRGCARMDSSKAKWSYLARELESYLALVKGSPQTNCAEDQLML